jgi:serine/threonine-protein kinase
MSDLARVTDTARMADTAELDLSGRQLGDYRILRRLGRGAMADVYLAEQSSLRRQIALKVLKRDLSSDETYVRRFVREAQAAAALIHANIVQIYEVGCIEGYHYIAQEYVQGQNLRELMTRHGLPEPKLALSILRQVTAALARAAEQGVIHRDIKPDNIMLTRQGEVKVADFGLARVSGNGDALNLTQIGVTMGTPLYMSPEQVEGRQLDTRSDLYSLGVTCYHMLTGEPPFRGETALAVAIQHVRTEPQRLETQRPDLPAALCRVIHKMMAKQPEQRFQQPRDVLRELRSLPAPAGDGQTSEAAEEWSAGELIALGEAPAYTQELDGLMKTQTLLATNRRWLKYLAAGVLGALIVGALLGLAARKPFLLAGEEARPAIQEKSTAFAQVQLALMLDNGNNSDAWEAVLRRFPNDATWAPVARKNLATLYLQRLRYDLALPLFKELEDTPLNLQLKALGLAGQAVIYDIYQDPVEVANKMADLRALTEDAKLPANTNLLDADMNRVIEQLGKRMQQESASSYIDVEELLRSLNVEVNTNTSDRSGTD